MPSTQVVALSIDPITPQNVYLTSPEGFFRSNDGGLTWTTMRLETNSQPVGLTLDPHNPARLFALLADGTLLRSEDSGTTWSAEEVGL